MGLARDPRIRQPIAAVGCTSDAGIPYLSPEVQLFYKAESPRPKDEVDFAAVLGELDPSQHAWLDEAVLHCYGDGHPWREYLVS